MLSADGTMSPYCVITLTGEKKMFTQPLVFQCSVDKAFQDNSKINNIMKTQQLLQCILYESSWAVIE